MVGAYLINMARKLFFTTRVFSLSKLNSFSVAI